MMKATNFRNLHEGAVSVSNDGQAATGSWTRLPLGCGNRSCRKSVLMYYPAEAIATLDTILGRGASAHRRLRVTQYPCNM